MGRLCIECLSKKIRTGKIAKAVYTALGQKTNIKCELVFTGAEGIYNLNRDTRGVAKITDVLSFPTLNDIKGVILDKDNYPTERDGRYLFLGSIVLCDEKVKEQAKEFGHSPERERTYLIIHGLMHLFGYDHMKKADKAEMREKEKAALKLLGIED